MSRRRLLGRRGFTLVEAVVCSLIVAIALTAALRTVAASRMAESRTAEHSRAVALASDLMAEILSKFYEDPDGGLIVFGPELLEFARSQFDDVDDYDGLSESTPVLSDGTPIDGATGWRRKVKVTWVALGNPASVSSSETGCKKIVVSVFHNSAWVYELTALQSKHALNMPGRDNAVVSLSGSTSGNGGTLTDIVGNITGALGGLLGGATR